MSDTPYTLGIEEEYLLVDLETGDLAEAPADLMEACTAELEGQVSPPNSCNARSRSAHASAARSARRATTSGACVRPSRTAPRVSG